VASPERPNFAARLQALADPDTVVIAESTRKLLGGLFDLQKRGREPLRGAASALRNPPQMNSGGQETSTTTALDPKSLKDRARLPSPSELDDWPGLDEANERLLAEKRAKEQAGG
jgi:hypothetical protein